MKQLVKFLNLNPSERGLVIGALFHLAAIRIGLWALPLQQLIKRLPPMAVARDDGRASNALPAERIAWAIRAVSRYLPGTGNCLAQSLTAQTMLARRGYSSQLRIGVAKDDSGRLKAHAWVECEGKIVIGAAGAAQYTAFPPLEFRRRSGVIARSDPEQSEGCDEAISKLERGDCFAKTARNPCTARKGRCDMGLR